MPSDTKCAKCGGTRGQMIHKVSLLDSDPWLEGVEDVHEFVPTTRTIVAGAFCKNHGTQWDHRCHECTYMQSVLGGAEPDSSGASDSEHTKRS